MTLWWFIVLMIYGLYNGWSNIGMLYWLLLIPFTMQDSHDSDLRKWIKKRMVKW